MHIHTSDLKMQNVYCIYSTNICMVAHSNWCHSYAGGESEEEEEAQPSCSAALTAGPPLPSSTPQALKLNTRVAAVRHSWSGPISVS